MFRTILAAALLLAALCACARQHPTAVALAPSTPIADQHSELAERADRGRVRPLQPPVAPDTRSPAPARPAPQRTVRPPARAVQASPATGDGWARLRQCESGGNYSDKRNPIYRGAYQFDRGSWASVGGTGDPADALPAEQDMRAQLLYARRGASPWPVCGRWLR